MDPQLFSQILQLLNGLAVPIVGALGIWGASQVKKMQARGDVKTMQDNAKIAVQAVEQLYPGEPGEVKKKMALQLAQQLNAKAGVSGTDSVQTTLNESNVLTLPPTKPVLQTPTMTTSLPPKQDDIKG